MPQITFAQDSCRQPDRALNFGALKFFRATPGLGAALFDPARLTHILFVDLASASIEISYEAPTVEVALDGGDPGVSFVAWQLDDRGRLAVNAQDPEFHDGSDWLPFTVARGAAFGDRVTRTRLRRADATLDTRGDPSAINGYSFRFGLHLPETAGETVSFVLSGAARRVVLQDGPCPRRVTVSGDRDSLPGLFPSQPG